MTFRRDAGLQRLKGALLLCFPRGWKSTNLVKRNTLLCSAGLMLNVHQYKNSTPL